MKLVQKMFVGLSLVGSLTLGSCSKEDVQVVKPEVSLDKTEANLRGLPVAQPYFAPTLGPTGFDIYPADWKRAIYPGNGSPDYPGTPSVMEFPTGVSNRTHAFGIASQTNQWIKPLSEVPTAPGINSFVTITSGSATTEVAKRADAITTIKNLVIGQKYSLNFYVATTAVNGPNAAYAKKVWASTEYPYVPVSIDLTSKKAEWVKGTIVFTALGSETLFYFAATSEVDNSIAYAHIHVDKNSIKKLL